MKAWNSTLNAGKGFARKPTTALTGALSTESRQMAAKVKPVKCKVCRTEYGRQRPGQKVCGPDCAAALAVSERAKAERKADRARKESMKSRAQWLREATTAFNAFIRARDWDQPCISCGRFHDGSYDAGHYRSVGSMPALRFHEDNCHKQCVPCNQHKAGNVVEYRLRLIARIGAERVAFLEGPHEPAKYTIDDAKAIKATYKAKLRQLSEEKS